MTKTLLALALVAASFGAVGQTTPRPADGPARWAPHYAKPCKPAVAGARACVDQAPQMLVIREGIAVPLRRIKNITALPEEYSKRWGDTGAAIAVGLDCNAALEPNERCHLQPAVSCGVRCRGVSRARPAHGRVAARATVGLYTSRPTCIEKSVS